MSTSVFGNQVQEKKIGDCIYQVTPLGCNDALKGLTRLARVLGPSLSALVDGNVKNPEIAFAKCLGVLISSPELEEHVFHFRDLFMKQTFVRFPDGKKNPKLSEIYEVQFAGRLKQMLEWLLFCFEVNYADFFRDAWTKVSANQDVLSGLRSTSENE